MNRSVFGKIGVLSGGISSEREISLRSGGAVHNALIARGYDAILIDVKGDYEKQLRTLDIDMAFIALHGVFGEDGGVQRILNSLGIPYTGSCPDPSALALDKSASKKVFMDRGIPTPRFITVQGSADASILGPGFTVPVVVKPSREGSSIGLTVVKDAVGIAPAVEKALKFDSDVIIEEYIAGRELTVGILEDAPLPVIEIKTPENIYDFGAKYLDKSTIYECPASLDNISAKKAQDIALRAHRAVGCEDLSRVDIRMSGNGSMYVLEVNTIPGMTERSLLPKAAAAAGIDFGDLCVKVLSLALKKKKGVCL